MPDRGTHDAASPGIRACPGIPPSCASSAGRPARRGVEVSLRNQQAWSSSSVARRATGQLVRGANAVFFNQLLAERYLIVGLPAHVEDFRLRPHMLLGTAMTLQAPLHEERVLLVSQR